MTLNKHIVIDPKIMVGKPVIAGTRIPVYVVLKKLADGQDIDAILRDYPRLTREDVRAVLGYAHDVVEGEDVYSVA